MDQCAHCRQKEGCEKDCGGCCGCQGGKEITLSLDRRQARLLLEFSQVPFLPLCQAAGAEGDGVASGASEGVASSTSDGVASSSFSSGRGRQGGNSFYGPNPTGTV